LLQHAGRLVRRGSLCDVGLRNNTAAAPALINNRHPTDLVFLQQSAAIFNACLAFDGRWGTRHCVAHSCLARIFARGYHAAGNVAVSHHANELRVIFALDHGGLTAVMLYHHLRRLLHAVIRGAAGRISRHDIFSFFYGILLL
jgi:hypothetical protein